MSLEKKPEQTEALEPPALEPEFPYTAVPLAPFFFGFTANPEPAKPPPQVDGA